MLDKQRLRTFLLGGAAGALVGILVAPRSGRELRGSLVNRAGEARERGRESYFETQERMRERLAETREGGPRRAEPEKEFVVGTAVSVPRPDPPHPPLRDVTFETTEVPEEHGRESGAGPEELRRRIREARERLNSQRDAVESDETDRGE